MKVLLSAFACEPHLGSEPEVGWQWALHVAELGHEVWVLTRSASRSTIERELVRLPHLNLRFVYCDLPVASRWCDNGRDWSLRIYYLLWQQHAAALARELHARECFERVHHVTYAGLRALSFMGSLGIPFILGPVGGGERAPWNLRFGYGLRGWLRDAARDAANLFVRVDPLMRRSLDRAEKIYVTSRDTLRLLPRAHRLKAVVELAIGSDDDLSAEMEAPEVERPDGDFRVLYVGQFLYLKGMHLGLPAFAQLLKGVPKARLTMIGQGPEKGRWQKLAQHLGIAASIDWMPWLPRAELGRFYRSHHVMLFPSLHDPGGMVVLEALLHALPVICLNIGGPGVLVTNECGRVVDVARCTEKDVIAKLGRSLLELTEEGTRLRLALYGQRRSREFSWKNKVGRIYGPAVRPSDVAAGPATSF